MIELTGVHKSFGTLEVLKDVTLTVPAGSVTVILGPSGSGKSTLLRCINHLEKVDRGRVRVDGELIGYRRVGTRLYELSERHILKQRARIGFVFQTFNLFPHMTALQNVQEAGGGIELLERVGLAEKADAYPRQLEAAAALGIPRLRQFRRILLPQAMRAILPNAANELVNLLKSTSVVYVLAIGELFYQVQVIYGRNGRVVPLLLVATVWYVILTAALSVLQHYVERRYSRGYVR